MKPAFITGANAKVKIGGITLAYAQDVSYNVTTTTIPIETMGRYEVVSNEPVAYFVDGTLSVIRYTKIASDSSMAGAAANGNGIGNWDFKVPNGTDGSSHVNPGKLLASQTFDLEIYQKYDDNGQVGESDVVVKLHDCRFVRKGGAINKRGVLVEQFAFNAIYKDDDSFEKAGSGDIDLS